MSSVRSRSGGRRNGTTLRRKNKSSRNRPCWIEIRRSLFVAATMRTLVLIGVRPPTVVYSPCCKHAQQPGLRFHRHVADLVEEQRAALGLLEAAGCALHAPP